MIQSARFRVPALLKVFLHGNAHAGGGPHVRNVEVVPAIIVEVEPCCAHAGADVLNAGFAGHTGKSAVAVVAVEIVAPKIVHNVQVGPEVAVVIPPSTAEAEARVIDVEASLLRDVIKGGVAVIAQ